VHPPGTEEFESTAVGWLLDVVPPDYRLHGVLRRYPVALAAMARQHCDACVAGARSGYRTARTDLGGVLPPHAVDAVLAAYRREGSRLAANATAAGLLERALRGETFAAQLLLDGAGVSSWRKYWSSRHELGRPHVRRCLRGRAGPDPSR
jgi:hypothetical protein